MKTYGASRRAETVLESPPGAMSTKAASCEPHDAVVVDQDCGRACVADGAGIERLLSLYFKGGGPRSRAASTDGEQFVDPTRRVRVHAREHVGQVRDRVGEIGIPIFSAELPESTFLLPNEDRPLFAVEPTWVQIQ